MRKSYINTLYNLAKNDASIIGCISDNGAIVYDQFRKDIPKQYFNFGISEANMVAAAAGMANCGLIPFIYTISNFLTMRAFEFIRNDVCMNRANVKIVGTGAGFAYSSLGSTHHATEDLALMRVLPYITILSPCSGKETEKATIAASKIDGPVYLRIGTGNSPEIYDGECEFTLGKGVTLKEGDDVTLFATGAIVTEALAAHELLKERNINLRVINIHTIKPIDVEIIVKAAKETKLLVTLEEHSTIGGLGDAVGSALLSNNVYPSLFKKIGLENQFAKSYGSYQGVRKVNGLDAEAVSDLIKGWCKP